MQPSNADAPIVIKLFGIISSVSPMQPANAPSEIVCTCSLNVSVVNVVLLKCPLGIVTISISKISIGQFVNALLSNSTFNAFIVSFFNFNVPLSWAKILAPTLVTLSGIVNSVIAVFSKHRSPIVSNVELPKYLNSVSDVLLPRPPTSTSLLPW